jgi:dihydrofolate reductase
MSKLRVNAFSLSLDGYGAGPSQSLETPLGKGGESLHEWIFSTRTFCQMYGDRDGETGPDDDFAARSFENIGAWIMGRNMFGPVRGEWPDEARKGWWGDNPPYHCDVFVLTHHARAPVAMEGGTVSHFVTDGIHAALERAREAAGGRTSASVAARRRSANISKPA